MRLVAAVLDSAGLKLFLLLKIKHSEGNEEVASEANYRHCCIAGIPT